MGIYISESKAPAWVRLKEAFGDPQHLEGTLYILEEMRFF